MNCFEETGKLMSRYLIWNKFYAFLGVFNFLVLPVSSVVLPVSSVIVIKKLLSPITHYRGVFKTLPNISIVTFCENS